MERLKAAAVKCSTPAETESEGDRGEADRYRQTEDLLSVVLTAHLVLCRVALLYPPRDVFDTDQPSQLHGESRHLAGSLGKAWELLGATGEARRQMLRRLVVLVGRQTLEARQQIHRAHYKQPQAGTDSERETIDSALGRESEGEMNVGQRHQPASEAVHIRILRPG